MKKNILITGTDFGLGFSLACRYLQEGWVVHALNRKIGSRLEDIKKFHKKDLFVYFADITREEEIKAAFDSISIKTPSLDILINNAGIHLDRNKLDIDNLNYQNIETMYSVNTIGPLRVVQHALPFIKNGLQKLIVNISSEAGSIGDCWRDREYGYCMSKAALNMMTRILQNRLKNDNIKVLAIHPGWLKTDMGGPDATDNPDDAALQIYQTLSHQWNIPDPFFIRRDGEPMHW